MTFTQRLHRETLNAHVEKGALTGDIGMAVLICEIVFALATTTQIQTFNTSFHSPMVHPSKNNTSKFYMNMDVDPSL